MASKDTLMLPLRKEWYWAIEGKGRFKNNPKREEYREIKPFWQKRLMNPDGSFKRYKYVVFSYGYTAKKMCFECKGIYVGKGNPEWGGGCENVYCIRLGARVW